MWLVVIQDEGGRGERTGPAAGGAPHRALVATHLIIPLAAAIGWTLGVLPALLPLRPVAAVLIPLGAVLIAYRVANRPSLDYSGPLYMDPLSGTALPVNLVRQLLRGPLLAAVLAALQILLAS